jgi:uncharacterized protein (TIGR02594 family)
MMKRRQFIKQSMLAGFGVGLGAVPLYAATQFKPNNSADYYSAYIPVLQQLGTKTPADPENDKGDELILGSPKGQSPLETMEYFARITETNSQGELYNAGWRERWNPVIVRFFECAGMKPSGDETFWCAACLNWVLERSGYVGTCNSSSSSFKIAGKDTNDPQPGDIVVFTSKYKKEADAGRGHVGLFLSRTDRSITVLGGNQKNKVGHYAVCEQVIDAKFPLVLHSFRSIDSLYKLDDPDASYPCKLPICRPPINRYSLRK